MRHDIPVKGRQRIEAQALLDSGYGSEVEVIRRYPRNPVEEAQCREDVVREPEIDEHSGEGSQEEPIARDIPDSVSDRAHYWVVLLVMESLVERYGHEGSWPYAERRIYQEASCQPREAITHEVRR